MRSDVILTGPIAPLTVPIVQDRLAAALTGGTWYQTRPGRRYLTWPDGRRVSAQVGIVDRDSIGGTVHSDYGDDEHNRWAASVFQALADSLPGVLVELLDEDDNVVRRQAPRAPASA